MAALPRIIIHNDETSHLEALLLEAHPGVPYVCCKSYDGLRAAIEAFGPDIVYSVRFAGSVGFPRDALFGTGGPTWVANGGVGTDHFGRWDPLQTTVTNAAGVASAMMAEYVLGGFLHFALDLDGLRRDRRAKIWAPRRMTPLRGKTLLVVGLGHTGRAIAARAKAFEMMVIGTRARPRPMEHVDEVHGSDELPRLMGRADHVAVCTPLIPATRGLIGQAEILAMKPGSVIADVSRGGVVDQRALHAALAEGRIAGAALDVFETEPLPLESPLWDLENVVLSPHASAVFDGWEEASFELFLDNLERYMDGAPLINVVDPDRGY